MKKIISLVLILGLVITVSAQKRKRGSNFSVEQKTELALKKMTLKLDLTKRQQNRIRPLLAEKIADRKTFKAQRKANKKNRKKLSREEKYERKIAHLDRRIAFKADMKDILNAKQYERFEKMSGRKAHKMKRKMKKRRKHKEQIHAPERA